jgi:hypothetical protein
MSRLSRQCGILNIWQPYRPPRSVTGIALLFYFYIICSCDTKIAGERKWLSISMQNTKALLHFHTQMVGYYYMKYETNMLCRMSELLAVQTPVPLWARIFSTKLGGCTWKWFVRLSLTPVTKCHDDSSDFAFIRNGRGIEITAYYLLLYVTLFEIWTGRYWRRAESMPWSFSTREGWCKCSW